MQSGGYDGLPYILKNAGIQGLSSLKVGGIGGAEFLSLLGRAGKGTL